MNEDLQIRAGDLRQRITIQSPSTTSDGEGGMTQTWIEVATLWADINPLSGKELSEAAKQQAEVDTEIRIRYRSGLDSTMRITQNDTGEIYDIRAILNLRARRRVMVLLCRKRT